MIKKKLAVIGTVGVPALYGGFETLLENLLDYLPVDFEVTVFCEANAYKHKITNYKGAKLVYLNYKANGFQSIFFDVISILKSFNKNDYLLILGVSGTIILPFIKSFCRAKIITNIDGMEWKRDKWGTSQKKFLKFSEEVGVKYSDLVISDNYFIQEHVKKNYNVNSTLIAYGGDHVNAGDDFSLAEKHLLQKSNYFFTVCRIEPENNIELLINAYLASKSQIPYVIVGNWQASVFGKRIKNIYASEANLRLLDPIYNQQELDQLRANCYYYLHGHSAGGTNPSLVEAMFLGLPIIAYGVSYNRSTTFDEALYFSDEKSLINILTGLEEMDRAALSLKMYENAQRAYTWKLISQKYIDAIKNL
jgi:glycosyltransferase involved in cell wall biosynthesis